MTKKSLSEELRQLTSTGGPPYDPEKVMAWFNRSAPAMLIELEVLEDSFNPDPNPPFSSNDFDPYLKRITAQAAQIGIDRRTIMRLFVDHAFDALQRAPESTPADSRRNADSVLQEAMRLHSIFDDPKDAA